MVSCVHTHTATHRNTLRHTTPHGNTLEHTATHCNTLQRTATHCNTLQHTATHCNTLHVCVCGVCNVCRYRIVHISKSFWCVAVCCSSVLQCVAAPHTSLFLLHPPPLPPFLSLELCFILSQGLGVPSFSHFLKMGEKKTPQVNNVNSQFTTKFTTRNDYRADY